jgi:hypothetical protein
MNNERLIMNSKTKIFFAKILSVAVIAVSVFQFGSLPAMAAAATGMSDTMSRNQISITGVSHSVTMTLPTGPFNGTLTLTYTNFTAFSGTPTGSCAGVGTVTGGTASSNVVTVTLGSCAAGTLTITSFTGTNPATAGYNTVTLGGAALITGTFAVATVTNDQVGVTASVDPSITFNVGAQVAASACDGTFSGTGGSVALGTLSTTSVTSSDANLVYHICSRLTTNAGSGAVVTVKSLYGALESTAVPGDTIASASVTPLNTGVSGYGLCIGSTGGTGFDVTVPVGVAPTRIAPFNNASCDSTNHNIGGVTMSAQNIWSISAASQNAYARIFVKAGIAGTVKAHTDYTDTLTFVATATF